MKDGVTRDNRRYFDLYSVLGNLHLSSEGIPQDFLTPNCNLHLYFKVEENKSKQFLITKVSFSVFSISDYRWVIYLQLSLYVGPIGFPCGRVVMGVVTSEVIDT